MAYESYPNTGHNNRAVTMPELEQLAGARLSGLIGFTGTTPVYADSSGRQVKIRSGVRALIRGMIWRNISETVVDNTQIVANATSNPRIDLLVLRMNRAAGAAFSITPVVITGTAAATPIVPSAVRQDTVDGTGVWDIPLAEIKVAAGATTIAAADVTNRAWWISGSGYVGFSLGRPPVEAGVVFTEQNTGIHWIGTTSGTYMRLASNSGVIEVPAPSGWSGSTKVVRAGDLVVASVAVKRTGSNIANTVVATVATLGAAYRPAAEWQGVYHCTGPDHSSNLRITTAGVITADPTYQGGGIDSGSFVFGNITWLAATA
ncbi:hypothetical protein [Actinoplanes sp. NBRC 101535]|uniref:hypothetical protein n=1 Tax=Actinoplanes sp. NBRC 101535 TaxID=3032196 RepID=UPI0024A0ED14|nr:hypothetical protein [Actinoplanes sp. NBRC 101535]GLY08277.1 hypothetical protein Acsp01_86560 [Actinoplanes sp. NBRC 101535]